MWTADQEPLESWVNLISSLTWYEKKRVDRIINFFFLRNAFMTIGEISLIDIDKFKAEHRVKGDSHFHKPLGGKETAFFQVAFQGEGVDD